MTKEINCPFCSEKIVSDVITLNEDCDGMFQCNNGHTFSLKYIETLDDGKNNKLLEGETMKPKCKECKVKVIVDKQERLCQDCLDDLCHGEDGFDF